MLVLIRAPLTTLLMHPRQPAHEHRITTELDAKRDHVIFKLNCTLSENALLLLKFFLRTKNNINIIDTQHGIISVPRHHFWEIIGKLPLILLSICNGVDTNALAENILNSKVQGTHIEYMSEVDGEAIIIAETENYDKKRTRLLTTYTEIEIVPLEEQGDNTCTSS